MALQSSAPDIYTQKFNSGVRKSSNRNSVPSVRIIAVAIFTSLYGLICYQMGAQSSSYSLLSASTVEQPWDHWEVSEPAAAQHDDEEEEETSQHDDDDEDEMSHLQRREAIDDSQLPYKCGLLFFYHIPSTGGSTINKWLLNFTPKGGGDIKYFTHWGRQHTIGEGDRVQNMFISGNDGGMDDFVLNLDPDEWRIAHCHHNSLHLNESEHYLESWRNAIEAQGCHFVGNIMFRESLSHTLSLYKHLKRYNSTKDEWTRHLKTQSDLGHWATELDFFLYNNLARNPYGVSKEEKVRRALEILDKHFEIVTVGNHARYKETLLKMTGWIDKEMPRHNTHKGELTFTKEQVEELQMLLIANGDTDFIRQVKQIYDE